MHRHYVEQLVAVEEGALASLIGSESNVLRVERRGILLVAELGRTLYATSPGSLTVPDLTRRQDTTLVMALTCDNYDTDPPSVTFFRAWDAEEELPLQGWPHSEAVVHRHYETGRPFLCRPGVREYHVHVQHGGQPWDLYRGKQRPRDLVLGLARDLVAKRAR